MRAPAAAPKTPSAPSDGWARPDRRSTAALDLVLTPAKGAVPAAGAAQASMSQHARYSTHAACAGTPVVKVVEVSSPWPMLKPGIVVVDAPGS